MPNGIHNEQLKQPTWNTCPVWIPSPRWIAFHWGSCLCGLRGIYTWNPHSVAQRRCWCKPRLADGLSGTPTPSAIGQKNRCTTDQNSGCHVAHISYSSKAAYFENLTVRYQVAILKFRGEALVNSPYAMRYGLLYRWPLFCFIFCTVFIPEWEGTSFGSNHGYVLTSLTFLKPCFLEPNP